MNPKTNTLPQSKNYAVGETLKFEIPRDRAAAAILVEMLGAIDLAAGGGTAGSVLTTPVNPTGAVSRFEITRDPESFAGPAVLNPQILHLFQYLMEGRKPAVTAIADGAVATGKSLYASWLIPLSLFEHPAEANTLLHLPGRSSFDVAIVCHGSLDLLRDSLLSGSNRALTINSSDPLRFQLTLIGYESSSAPKPDMEVGLIYKRLSHTAAGESPLNIGGVGQRVLAVGGCVHNNSVRSDTFATRVYYDMGKDRQDNFIFSALQRKNQRDLAVANSDWATGLFFIDNIKKTQNGSPEEVPEISAPGEIPVLKIDSGTTAPTASSFTDVLSLVAAWTPDALAKIRAG